MTKWIIGVLVVLVLGAGAWFLLSGAPQQQGTSGHPGQTPSGSTSGTTGGSGSTQGTPGSASTTPSRTLVARDGSVVTVPDFTRGAESYTLPAGTYYELTNNQATQGSAAEYDIVYGTDSSITVSLLKEPLGQARLLAETKLRTLIPVSDAALCTLDVTVGVPYGVNQFYAGQNLGLSFCPNAVSLPQ